MSFISGLILGSVGSLFKTSLVLVGTAGVVCYFTKPTDKSFKKEIEHRNSKVPFGKILSKVCSKVGVNNYKIHDCIFFKIGIYNVKNEEPEYYLGILNNWIKD